jgi:hypothetical protein
MLVADHQKRNTSVGGGVCCLYSQADSHATHVLAGRRVCIVLAGTQAGIVLAGRCWQGGTRATDDQATQFLVCHLPAVIFWSPQNNCARPRTTIRAAAQPARDICALFGRHRAGKGCRSSTDGRMSQTAQHEAHLDVCACFVQALRSENDNIHTDGLTDAALPRSGSSRAGRG